VKWLEKHEALKSEGFCVGKMESFFHLFKAECVHENNFLTEKELRETIIEYVGFYD